MKPYFRLVFIYDSKVWAVSTVIFATYDKEFGESFNRLFSKKKKTNF